MIRTATLDDASAICDIYNHYIKNTIVTFEEEPLTSEAMQGRIEEITATLPWLVFENESNIVGFAYASRWNGRCAYRYAVESTLYLTPNAIGRGIGKQLYRELIDILKQQSMHSIIGGVALPNPASVALHEKLGFKKVAHFEQVGWKFNQWIDVAYWELILEKPQ